MELEVLDPPTDPDQHRTRRSLGLGLVLFLCGIPGRNACNGTKDRTEAG
ncbi:MAG: hypothetical protein KatS3mg110_2954 [Pirellulaceae bacterium]|nr:MAG: hypothetical protein KatS3mg110_2954 [Pirellulaceae bacterium]